MPSVVELVKERFGELSEIQKISIPKVLAGENVLIVAPTGYGKTESVLLPILEKLKDEKEGICALYITPLRALSRDLKERFNWWCERLEISHDIRTGDTTQHERTKQRTKPPKILLTTVESLQALLLGKVMRNHLTKIKFVIVDEIHDILDNKRGAQLSLGLERLNEISNFQRIGISATIADETQAARLLFGERPYSMCEVGKIRKMDFSVHANSKIETIKELVETNRSLLFVNTRSTAEELGASLKKLGAPIEVHHGSLSKEVRLSAEDRFKSGELKSIICTSSLELGIDVGDVNLIIQYGSPHQVFRLIQRVGRSGHSMTKTPKGIIFTNDFDDFLEAEVISSLAQNGWMEKKQIERGTLDVIAHQVVGLLIDFGRMPLKKTHEILSRSYAYGLTFDKLRMVALQLFGEGILYYDEDPQGEITIRAAARAREYYYTFLSTIPKTKRFAMKDISSNKIISSLDEEFVVKLEPGASFFSKGMPFRVVDITESEVLAEPSYAMEIAVPSWTGEDIPVSFEVAQNVGQLRATKKDVSPLPDDKTVIVEISGDVIIIHACFGTKVNEVISRIFASNLNKLIGENVLAVSDPYRILVKLPFPLKEENILQAFNNIRNPRSQLEEALIHSSLLKFKFLHVGRMFGLLSEDATITHRFIEALRNSVVYEETIRSIFFRYFDIPKTSELLGQIKKGSIKLIVDKRDKPSFFAKIGIERFSGADSAGTFEPREVIVRALKENILSKTIELLCLNCKATRFMHLAGASEKIVCHKCKEPALTILRKYKSNKPTKEAQEEEKLTADLIRAHGKTALIALSSYGVGPSTAARVLRRLHKDEQSFYLDLLEAQKLFIKNKKYWKLD
ncbi:DEAD/DEAH box helicase [Candidatus Micrarchaeota archaeon]|nr:DEAD/DEAH box helicase [Candidatus Micrarchaeota archaeon]